MRILFLSTWFPYPPILGGKIREYNLLKGLAARHQVGLISFEDVPIEKEWLAELQNICERVEIVKHAPFRKDSNKNLAGWFSPLPRDVVASYSPDMKQATQKIAEEWQPDVVVASTFVTARYAININGSFKVVDVDNVMTRLMQDALQQASSLKERLRRLLAWWKFRRYEKWLYSQFDLCLSVTPEDQKKITQLFGIPISKTRVVPNGAFIEENRNRTISPQKGTLVFNGSLTYKANFDAMMYFLNDIFPMVCREVPGVTLKITGSTEGVPFDLLPKNDRVEFTGFLEDVKPVVANSWACVVPLRVGGGTRIKILEAMALGTPVVSTRKGAEGIDAVPGEHLLMGETAEQFSRQTIDLLNDGDLRNRISKQARQMVEKKYNWQTIQQDFCDLVEACKREHA